MNLFKYYAIVDTIHYPEHGFISRESYNNGSFIPLATSALTNGNRWSQYNGPDLVQVITKMIKAGFTFYEFDTAKEMFAFLAKQN